MAIKFFSKLSDVETDLSAGIHDPRVEKMENHINELSSEVVRLRQEMNTLLARQQTFRVALKRLREYLEERGATDERRRGTQQIEGDDGTPTAAELPRPNKSKDNLH